MSDAAVDLRCPRDTRRLFGRVLREGTIVEDNLIEFACTDCRKKAKIDDPGVLLVLHRFNVLGECVETVTTRHG